MFCGNIGPNLCLIPMGQFRIFLQLPFPDALNNLRVQFVVRILLRVGFRLTIVDLHQPLAGHAP